MNYNDIISTEDSFVSIKMYVSPIYRLWKILSYISRLETCGMTLISQPPTFRARMSKMKLKRLQAFNLQTSKLYSHVLTTPVCSVCSLSRLNGITPMLCFVVLTI